MHGALPHRWDELYKMQSWDRRKLRLIESNAKCSYLKIDLPRDFVAGVFLSEAPSPPSILFGVEKLNFVGSESGQLHIM